MSYHQAIAKNLKKHCSQQEITYSELSRRANIPLSTIQGLLYRSRKEPKISTIHAIAKALKVKIEELLK